MRKKRQQAGKRALKVFAVGALGYGLIEWLYRGHTHWTMLLTGGACFSGLYAMERAMKKRALWLRALAGAGMITAAEYAVGQLVNRRLGWHVWDYSHLRGHIQGQICPQFFAVWYALCLPAFQLCAWLEKKWG